MAKRYKISSVDYEFCFKGEIIRGTYSSKDYAKISETIDKWTDYPMGFDEMHKDCGFNPSDGYDYVDSIEELIPPQLTSADKERLRAEIKKHLIEIK